MKNTKYIIFALIAVAILKLAVDYGVNLERSSYKNHVRQRAIAHSNMGTDSYIQDGKKDLFKLAFDRSINFLNEM